MTSYMKDCKHLHPHFFPEQPFYPKVDVHFHISNSQVLQKLTVAFNMYLHYNLHLCGHCCRIDAKAESHCVCSKLSSWHASCLSVNHSYVGALYCSHELMSGSESCPCTQGSAPACAYTVSPPQGFNSQLHLMKCEFSTLVWCMLLWPLTSLTSTLPAEVFHCTFVCHAQPLALLACLIDSPYVPLINGNVCSAD